MAFAFISGAELVVLKGRELISKSQEKARL